MGVWWVLPLGLAISLGVLLTGSLRHFGYAMAATIALAALVRLVMPSARAGGLIVRSRAWDVVLMCALSAATALLSANLIIR